MKSNYNTNPLYKQVHREMNLWQTLAINSLHETADDFVIKYLKRKKLEKKKMEGK